MSPLRIKVYRPLGIDPKAELRSYVDQLPPEKQREFVLSALQLIAERRLENEAALGCDYRHAHRERKQ